MACEPLERRTMLCAPGVEPEMPVIGPAEIASAAARSQASTLGGPDGGPDGGQIDIIWVNENTTTGTWDNRFDDVFGANAAAAKAVVNAVIDAWERVIVSFNYTNGAPDVYSLYVSMEEHGERLGGFGSATHYNNGKPDIGSAVLGRGRDGNGDGDGDGIGWYLDPTPNEHSEFLGSQTNAFAGKAHPNGNPAFGLDDFYTVVAMEITHCLGITSGANNFQSSPYLNPTTIPDTAEGGGIGYFWTFAGPSISHLMTTNNGGSGGSDYGVPIHTAGPGVPVATIPGGVYLGAQDVGNAAFSASERYLVSNTARLILQDAYGYTTRNPAEFGTFYAVLNETTGQLTVRGGDGESTDNVTISLDGSDVVVSVDINPDIPGIGHLPGAGNLGAFVTRYPAADVGSILVDTGHGHDVIRINGTEAPTTVDGDAGNDTIYVGDDDIDSNLLANIEVLGGGDTDRLNLEDRDDLAGNDFYRLTSASFIKGPVPGINRRVDYGGFESIQLSGNNQNSVYDVRSVPTGTTFVTFAGSGNDSFNLATSDIDFDLGANVTVNGGNGADDVIFQDSTDGAGGDVYELIAGRLTKDPMGVNRRININGMESLRIDGSPQPSTYYVLGVAANLPVTIDAGDANDNVHVAGGDIDRDIDSNVTVNGNGGTDVLSLNDIGDDLGEDEYTVTQTSFEKPSRAIRYQTIESIILSGSPQNDTLRINGTPLGTLVELGAGEGTDAFVLGSGDLDNVRTGLILRGQGGTDSLGIDDAGDAGNDTYQFTSTTFSKTADGGGLRQMAQFDTMESMFIFSNNENSTFNVQSTHASTPLTLLGGDGVDTFNIGQSGIVAGILGAVFAQGFGDIDRLNYTDGASTTLNEYTVDDFLVRRSNVADVDAQVDEIVLNCGDAADIVNVLSTVGNVPLTVNGQGGADAFFVGNGNWDASIGAAVAINGNAGADSLFINDTADTGLDDYTITATQATKNSIGNDPISFATIEDLVLDANGGNNVVNVNGTFNGDVRVRANGGRDDIIVNDNFLGRPVFVDGGADIDDVFVNNDATGNAAAQFDSTQDLALLQVGIGGLARVNAGGDKVLRVNELLIAGGVSGFGALDLNDNVMIWDYASTQTPDVRPLLLAGRNGGAWNGPGIRSSTAAAGTTHALGYAKATDLFSAFPATFEGQSVDETSLLVKYTWYGDANLDETVNLTGDFNRYAVNFGTQSGMKWSQGDFNYDGAADLGDFNLLAINFGQSGVGPEQRDGDKDNSEEEVLPPPPGGAPLV